MEDKKYWEQIEKTDEKTLYRLDDIKAIRNTDKGRVILYNNTFIGEKEAIIKEFQITIDNLKKVKCNSEEFRKEYINHYENAIKLLKKLEKNDELIFLTELPDEQIFIKQEGKYREIIKDSFIKKVEGLIKNEEDSEDNEFEI